MLLSRNWSNQIYKLLWLRLMFK